MSGLPESFKVPYDPGLRAGGLVVSEVLCCFRLLDNYPFSAAVSFNNVSVYFPSLPIMENVYNHAAEQQLSLLLSL